MDARVRTDTDPSVTVEPFDRAGAFLVFDGAVDVCSDGLLRDAVASAIEADYRQLVVDFATTTFLDSGAFRALVDSVEPLRDVEDAAVVLVGATGCVRHLLDLVDADELFPHYDDRDTARRALRLPAPETAWRDVPSRGR
jgi:anti-anti-sigma factor